MLKPLPRAEFQAVIRRVLSELERVYKERLLYVAAFGSVAREAETPRSDIDLLAIVRSGPAQTHAWLYRTTPVDVSVLPLREVRQRIFRVDALWPHEAGALLAHKVYLDRGRIAERLRQWHSEALRRRKRPVEPHAGFYEYFGKMERGWEARDPQIIRRVAWEMFFMSCMDLARLNGRFYVDHMRMLEQIREFAIVPNAFVRHARNLFHSDLRKVHGAAQALFQIHLRLAEQYGYSMKSLTRLDQIRIPRIV